MGASNNYHAASSSSSRRVVMGGVGIGRNSNMGQYFGPNPPFARSLYEEDRFGAAAGSSSSRSTVRAAQVVSNIPVREIGVDAFSGPGLNVQSQHRVAETVQHQQHQYQQQYQQQQQQQTRQTGRQYSYQQQQQVQHQHVQEQQQVQHQQQVQQQQQQYVARSSNGIAATTAQNDSSSWVQMAFSREAAEAHLRSHSAPNFLVHKASNKDGYAELTLRNDHSNRFYTTKIDRKSKGYRLRCGSRTEPSIAALVQNNTAASPTRELPIPLRF